MQKKVAIYARVSTKDQDPDTQLITLREYAKNRGFKIYNEYVDVDSGDKDHREQFNKLFEAARKRTVDVVLVWRFDRFARSTKMLLTALDEFKNIGVDFISFQENIDTTSPFGKAMFIITSAIAEFEKELIAQRVKAGLEKAKIKGKKLGRPALSELKKNRIIILRKKGLSIRKIAQKEDLSVGVVYKYVKKLNKIKNISK